MMPKTLISLSGGVISNPLRRLAAPVDFELREGESIALEGPNGSGKSTVLEMLRGGFFLREGTLQHNLNDESYRAIRTVEFDNAYSTSETQYYYQQRWQAFEREASPLAGELLSEAGDDAWQQQLFDILNITPLLSKEIITLSSGELRRFSIARALLHRPQVLILENPFIGLDPPTRRLLNNLMDSLSSTLGISFIITLTSAEQIPQVATHAYFMDGGRISAKMTAEAARAICTPGHIVSKNDDAASFFHPAPAFDTVVEMRRVNIAYGPRQIFRDLNWKVRSGEKWNVTGPNGSGKSTLLSLVNADNPRAYSLDITLFDRRRGTGESIWDIKRHIGFLSSEMHSSFITSDTVLEIIRGGMTDRYGDCERSLDYARDDSVMSTKAARPRGDISCASEDPANANLMRWLKLFGAEDLANRRYNTLSSGEQRYILLIRAFVKDPDLLILDEPFQGLDPERRRRAAAVIEAFSAAENKTLLFVTHYIEEVPGVVTNTLQL